MTHACSTCKDLSDCLAAASAYGIERDSIVNDGEYLTHVQSLRSPHQIAGLRIYDQNPSYTVTT